MARAALKMEVSRLIGLCLQFPGNMDFTRTQVVTFGTSEEELGKDNESARY